MSICSWRIISSSFSVSLVRQFLKLRPILVITGSEAVLRICASILRPRLLKASTQVLRFGFGKNGFVIAKQKLH